MAEGVNGWIDRLKQIPEQASALGRQGMDGLRNAGAKVAEGYRAGAAGGFQGAMDHAAGSFDAGKAKGAAFADKIMPDSIRENGLKGVVQDAGSKTMEGLRSMGAKISDTASSMFGGSGQPPGRPPNTTPMGEAGNFNGRPAPADGFKVGANGAIEADAAKAAPKGGLLRGAARLGGWTAAAMGAMGAGEEAVDQMNTAGIAGALGKQEGLDAKRDAKATDNPFARNSQLMQFNDPLVQNRIARLKGMGQAALDAINPFSSGKEGLRAPASPGATMANVNGNMIPTNQGPQTPDQLLDGNAVPASGNGAFRNNQTRVAQKVGGNGSYDGMLPNLNPNATPEEAAQYLQKSQDLGAIAAAGREGLRKDLGAINGTGAGSVPQGLQDVAKQGPAGAIASLSAYGAMSRMGKNQADVGLRRDANSIAAQKSSFDMASKNRDAKMKQDEVNRGTMEKEFEDFARSKVGEPKMNETAGDHGARVKGKLSEIRSEINYSLGNRKDGKKLEDLSGAERQQLLLAKNFKDRAAGDQGGITKYFGNKDFESRDLYSYIPKSVKPTLTGGYDVVMPNGNTMKVSKAQGGGFNLFGSNDPVDADLAAMITPLVDKHEKKPQGFRNEMPVIGNRG